ncbi:protein NRT1/ PTR FAMILY 5.9 [Cinnamomum micranthum f. kanehirae]|uniref:Protein NRT1/ PTR FAMILY 5.9 n=1 Tax=Cinnamomum micranthum f. kanehirae TaxID=337451 RepID=A0A3S3MVM7_9MAGN|nr:protein NRT1/ PTR FAMILY 5.9 [Cinnamomum micranthum f. kanehirae]
MSTGGKKSSAKLSRSCVLIIVIAGVERFAYKGVASNLVTYLTDVVGMKTSSAAKTVNSWGGVTSMLPLVGAFLADSYWDQYSTILASSMLYVVGLVALTSTALLSTWTSVGKAITSFSLFFSLYLISFAQGGYNPCLQAFGAAQLENPEDELLCTDHDEKNTNKKSLFFQWWYFGVCTGSLLGVTVMSYIQDTFGWGWGFAIPTIAMVISVGFLSCGTHLYVHKQSKRVDKPVEAMIQSIKAASTKMMPGRISLPQKESDAIELQLQETPLKDDFKTPEMLIKNPSRETNHLDDLRAVRRLLPIWTMLLMFAVIFQQPSTFFTKQGMTMKRHITDSFMVPPATLQSVITISIIILMPFYDRAIIPVLRLITRQEKGINVLQRMGIGMFLSIVAMVVAAVVESKRLQVSRESGIVHSQTTVPLSIFWLMPQYVLLGVSDVFTVVGMQEFFYNQVPSRMRTTGIALYLSVFGFGSFLSAVLISMVELVTSSNGQKQSWFSDDLNQARIDNYYWLLALLCTLSLLLFIALSKHYTGRNEIENGSCK